MPMEARPRPFLRMLHVPVPDRIQVDVIAMSEVVLLVADSVLPITLSSNAANERLPHPAASLAAPGGMIRPLRRSRSSGQVSPNIRSPIQARLSGYQCRTPSSYAQKNISKLS